MAVWILVANGCKAFLYQTKHLRNKELSLLATFDHPESREKDQDLVSDHQGKLQTGHGARSAYEAHDPKEIEIENFAKQLSRHLDAGRKQNKFEKLLIIAHPHFYGLIHKNLGKKADNILHLPKDYTRYPVAKLSEFISAHF